MKNLFSFFGRKGRRIAELENYEKVYEQRIDNQRKSITQHIYADAENKRIISALRQEIRQKDEVLSSLKDECKLKAADIDRLQKLHSTENLSNVALMTQAKKLKKQISNLRARLKKAAK